MARTTDLVCSWVVITSYVVFQREGRHKLKPHAEEVIFIPCEFILTFVRHGSVPDPLGWRFDPSCQEYVLRSKTSGFSIHVSTEMFRRMREADEAQRINTQGRILAGIIKNRVAFYDEGTCRGCPNGSRCLAASDAPRFTKWESDSDGIPIP